MGLTSSKSLFELKEEFLKFEGNFENIKFKNKKDEYIRFLRNKFLHKKYPNEIPKPLSLALELDSPMLCENISKLKSDKVNNIWNSDEWLIEEKYDGVRALVVFTDNDYDIFSRAISENTYLPKSFKNNIAFKEDLTAKIKRNLILDCEIIANYQKNTFDYLECNFNLFYTSNSEFINTIMSLSPQKAIMVQNKANNNMFKFQIFDILYLDNNWMLDMPLIKRKKKLIEIKSELDNMGFPYEIVNHIRTNKRAFASTLLDKGAEGFVFKNIYSLYNSSGSRRRDCWLKYKVDGSDINAFSEDTIDCFVSGILTVPEGLVLILSVFIDEERETSVSIAKTKISPNEIFIKDNILNKVVEIRFLDNNFLSHFNSGNPIDINNIDFMNNEVEFIRFRDDKTLESCTSLIYPDLFEKD